MGGALRTVLDLLEWFPRNVARNFYVNLSNLEIASLELQRFGVLHWSGLVLWTGCFEGCWLLLVVLCPLARVLVG